MIYFFKAEDPANCPTMQSGKALVLKEAIPLGSGSPDFVLQAKSQGLEIVLGLKESREPQNSLELEDQGGMEGS